MAGDYSPPAAARKTVDPAVVYDTIAGAFGIDMITREADYAMRTVLYLAREQARDASVSTAVLAEEMEVPFRFLRRIVRTLVDAKIIASQRGKGGGIRLLRPKEEVSLLQIIEAVDPKNIKFNTCLTADGACSRSQRCAVHPELVRLQDAIEQHLGQITMDKIV